MRSNVALSYPSPVTHEGAPAVRINSDKQLRRLVLSTLLGEKQFYSDGVEIADAIKAEIPKVKPETVAALAAEARTKYKLRHVPLLLVREMACLTTPYRRLVADILSQVIQRPDEMGEYLSLYWSNSKQPVSAQSKKGLARAFAKFSEYQLAKWNRKAAIKLRDVLRICHPTPKDDVQAALWKRVVADTLATPDTWEVALSSGADKKATWERLLQEQQLGAIALLMNLRNMQAVNVDEALIRHALATMKTERVWPFRFITASRYAPQLEPDLEQAMFRCLTEGKRLDGRTILLVDVSGSMDDKLSTKSEMTRLDAACGLAVLCRELCESVRVCTFSEHVVEVPARRGFALRDAIASSQRHSGTYLGKALAAVATLPQDRLIVFTDEQSHDVVPPPPAKGYMVNVASAQHGVGYGPWTHVDGFSEAVFDWIGEHEKEDKF